MGLNDALQGSGADGDQKILSEVARLLKPDGTLLVSGDVPAAQITPLTDRLGLRLVASERYTSPVIRFAWEPVLVFRKALA